MTIGEFLNNNVGAIISLLISVGTYAIIHAKYVQKTESRITELEKEMEEHKNIHGVLDRKIDSINAINVTLAQIQVDIVWIREKIREKM